VIARQGKTLVAAEAGKANKSMTGTPMYMSPEVIKGENPGRAGAVDVWSLGCVILEMATGRRPWASLDNEWAIMYNIAQGNPPQLPSSDQLSPEGIDFLRKCFIRDPKKRASAAELLQHEWIIAIKSQVAIDPGTPSDSGSSSHSNSRGSLGLGTFPMTSSHIQTGRVRVSGNTPITALVKEDSCSSLFDLTQHTKRFVFGFCNIWEHQR
jgi:mitogen-activated protein kinase kinase kinase